uniref:Uncharacterized protein n=1 Tax=viral metagenome TaxID=1070528 RepID=A0A6M3JK84_9ZZZZ
MEKQNGWFSTRMIDKAMGITTRKQQDNRRNAIRYLKKIGLLECHPTQKRVYRYTPRDIAADVSMLNYQCPRAVVESIVEIKEGL